MSVYRALEQFMHEVPNRIPIGYWEQDGQYIFNTKSAFANDRVAAPAQYVVTSTGEVYGTNPIQSNLDPAKLKSLPGGTVKRRS